MRAHPADIDALIKSAHDPGGSIKRGGQMCVYLPQLRLLGAEVVVKVPRACDGDGGGGSGGACGSGAIEAAALHVRTLLDMPVNPWIERLQAVCPERCAFVFPRAPGETLASVLARCRAPPPPPPGAAPSGDAAQALQSALRDAARVLPWSARLEIARQLGSEYAALEAARVVHLDGSGGAQPDTIHGW
jgi:hypothetical protein